MQPVKSSAFLLISLVAALFVTCTTGSPPGAAVRGQDPDPSLAWRAEYALQAEEKLGGCATGDLRPGLPGEEIVAVSESGKVYAAWCQAGGWRSAPLFDAPGELIQVAVGEVDAGAEGPEIVAVGMADGPESGSGPGAVYVVRRVDDAWRGQRILRTDKLVHGVCVHDGAIYAVGFDREVFRLGHDGEGWQSEAIAALPGAGKTCFGTRKGIYVACNDGSLVLVGRTGTGWRTETIDKRGAGRARLGSDGRRIAVADDDGTLSLVEDGKCTKLWQIEPKAKLRGAVVGDLEPGRAGVEAACAGYDKRVHILRKTGTGWQAALLHEEPGAFHHLVAADVDGTPGLELVGCGFAGNVVVLRRARKRAKK